MICMDIWWQVVIGMNKWFQGRLSSQVAAPDEMKEEDHADQEQAAEKENNNIVNTSNDDA